MKNKYTIDELNNLIQEERHKNIGFIKNFVEGLKMNSSVDKVSPPDTLKLKCSQRGLTAFQCNKCGIVYHGVNLCPLCDTEALVNSKWCDNKLTQFHTSTGTMSEGCHWTQGMVSYEE